jgi:cytochrome oxidase Cu insertion factor (SCO1/SenC/PrrC family)
MKRDWKHVVCLGLLNIILVPFSSSLAHAQNKSQNKVEKEAAPMKLKVGDIAPDFTLLAFDGKELKKVSLKGLPREEERCPGILRIRLYRWLNSVK